MGGAVETSRGGGQGGSTTRPRAAIRKLAFSRGVTYAGGNAAFWALSVTLYEQTQSVTVVAVAALASFSVPAAISPLAGSLGDRFDRRRVMIVSELAGALCFLGLAVAVDWPAALLALRVLASIAWSPLEPATNAALPCLVSDEQFEDANAAISKAGIAGCLIGSAAAAVVLPTFGASVVFLVNSATFLFSAAVISSIRGDFRPRVEERNEVSAGFSFLRQHPVLRPVTLAFAATFFGIGLTIPVEIVIATEFGAGSLGYAMMFTFWGIGGLLGASAGNRLKYRPRKVKLMAAACLTVAGGFLAVSAAPVFAIVIFGMALGGVGEGLWEITQNSLIQRVTPDGIRSRVFAASTAAMQATIALGLLASGAVTAAFGASGAFAVAGAAALGATLILVLDGALAARRQSGHAPAAAQAAAKRRRRPRAPAQPVEAPR